MQTSRFLFTIGIAGAGIVTTCAQNLTPADYDKMVEALRQKVAEERTKTSAAPELRSLGAPAPAAAMPALEKRMESAPPPSTAAPQISESPEVRRMLEAVRSAVAKERAADSPKMEAPAPTRPPTPARPPVKEIPAASVTASTAQPAPEPEAGPKTKQERLSALLLLYRADKLTPQEYHEQRAKLLAEP